MNPVELLSCPVPAACPICGQEVIERMFAFGPLARRVSLRDRGEVNGTSGAVNPEPVSTKTPGSTGKGSEEKPNSSTALTAPVVFLP